MPNAVQPSVIMPNIVLPSAIMLHGVDMPDNEEHNMVKAM